MIHFALIFISSVYIWYLSKLFFIIGQKMALKAEIVFLKVSDFGRVVFFLGLQYLQENNPKLFRICTCIITYCIFKHYIY